MIVGLVFFISNLAVQPPAAMTCLERYTALSPEDLMWSAENDPNYVGTSFCRYGHTPASTVRDALEILGDALRLGDPAMLEPLIRYDVSINGDDERIRSQNEGNLLLALQRTGFERTEAKSGIQPSDLMIIPDEGVAIGHGEIWLATTLDEVGAPRLYLRAINLSHASAAELNWFCRSG